MFGKLSVDNKRWLIGLITLSVEVKLVNDTGRNALVVLSEIEHQAVRYRRKDLHHRIWIVLLSLADNACNLLGECCGMPPA